jgi:prevent-host-death family protein
MDAISYTSARQNLAETMERVIDDHDAIIITRKKYGSVVMMSLDDFNSMQETMYLLGNPVNAEHLRTAIADLDAGKGIEMSPEDL